MRPLSCWRRSRCFRSGQWLILFLRYYADLDYQQIADALELRRGTVSAALHSAHQTLRRHLEEMIER
jgi:DNA-directed RNA polymerase specialized sigma24 family protein